MNRTFDLSKLGLFTLDDGTQVGFLKGPQGRLLSEAYYEAVEHRFGNNGLLLESGLQEQTPILRYNPKTQTVEGSNFYAAVVMNSIFQPLGFHVATPLDIQRLRDKGYLPQRTEVDLGFALWKDVRECPVNFEYLRQSLESEIRKKCGRSRLPAFVPADCLDLEPDDSNFGFHFALTSPEGVVFSEKLERKNNERKYFMIGDDDLPEKFFDNGPRTFYAHGQGIAGVKLDDRGNLSATCYDFMESSNPRKRIVISNS